MAFISWCDVFKLCPGWRTDIPPFSWRSHTSLHGRFLSLCVNRWMLELLPSSTYLLTIMAAIKDCLTGVCTSVCVSLCGSVFSYLLGAHKKRAALPCRTLVKVLANCQSNFARWDGAFLFPPATCECSEFFPVLATLILSHSLQPCLWVKGQFIGALTYISLVGSDAGHLVCWLAVLDGIFRQCLFRSFAPVEFGAFISLLLSCCISSYICRCKSQTRRDLLTHNSPHSQGWAWTSDLQCGFIGPP